MQRTHKIKLDTTLAQRQYFTRCAGTHRFVYNWALDEWNRQYIAEQKPSANSLKKEFNAIYKTEFPWISDVHRDCHSQPFADLNTAYSRFFAKCANKPRFKSRNRCRTSFYVANDKLRFDKFNVRLPIIGWVKLRETLRFAGKINSARVIEDAGQWFICVSVDIGDDTKSRTGNATVGVDLGIKTLATLSTGETFDNPKPLRKAQKKLKRAQRKLSRRVKGSKNKNKQRLKVAKIHQRIKNIRRDNLHKLTTQLTKNHGTIVIEDLNVKGMMKNHKLAQAISDVSFGIFRALLMYKSNMYENKIIVADRFFPSSKRCSSCGKIKDKLLLSDRVYKCDCGLILDRDLNAAINLKQLGQTMPEVTTTDNYGVG